MRKADVFLFASVIEGHPRCLGQQPRAASLYRDERVSAGLRVDGKTGFLVATLPNFRRDCECC